MYLQDLVNVLMRMLKCDLDVLSNSCRRGDRAQRMACFHKFFKLRVLDNGQRMVTLGTPACNVSTTKAKGKVRKKLYLDMNDVYWVSRLV